MAVDTKRLHTDSSSVSSGWKPSAAPPMRRACSTPSMVPRAERTGMTTMCRPAASAPPPSIAPSNRSELRLKRGSDWRGRERDTSGSIAKRQGRGGGGEGGGGQVLLSERGRRAATRRARQLAPSHLRVRNAHLRGIGDHVAEQAGVRGQPHVPRLRRRRRRRLLHDGREAAARPPRDGAAPPRRRGRTGGGCRRRGLRVCRPELLPLVIAQEQIVWGRKERGRIVVSRRVLAAAIAVAIAIAIAIAIAKCDSKTRQASHIACPVPPTPSRSPSA